MDGEVWGNDTEANHALVFEPGNTGILVLGEVQHERVQEEGREFFQTRAETHPKIQGQTGKTTVARHIGFNENWVPWLYKKPLASTRC